MCKFRDARRISYSFWIFPYALCSLFCLVLYCVRILFLWLLFVVRKYLNEIAVLSGRWVDYGIFFNDFFWRFFWFFFDWLGYFEPCGLNFELLRSGGWALGPWGSQEIESLSRLNPQKVLLITYAFSTWQFVQGFQKKIPRQGWSLIEPKNNQKI